MQLPVGLAMRYGEPSILHGLDELLARAGELDELVVVPLYPHYAMASTKTVEVAVDAALRGKKVRYRFVPPFYDDPGYLDALAARHAGRRSRPARSTCSSAITASRSGTCARWIRPARIACNRRTAATRPRKHGRRATAIKCSRRWRAWRNASVWARAATALRSSRASAAAGSNRSPTKFYSTLPARGVKRLAVVCPSFVADCLETLEEMEMRGRETFLEAGGEAFTYVRCLNDDPAWIDALAALCRKPAPVPA